MTEPRAFRYHAYLSHGQQERDWAHAFYQRLTAAGLNIWFQEEDIAWGESLRLARTKGLKHSRHAIVLLSPGTLAGDWPSLERLIATLDDPANAGRSLLPLRIAACDLPDDLRPFHCLDVFDAAALDHHWPRILATLCGEPQGPLIPERYRRHLTERYGSLETLVRGETPLQFRLKRVYTPLKTDWLEPERRQREKADAGAEKAGKQARPLADLLDLPGQPGFVIVGGPGSGKTTFIAHTALAQLEVNRWLPVPLQLVDFGRWLKDRTGEQGVLLLHWAGEVLAKSGLPPYRLMQWWQRGKLLWLLDGLDEIFEGDLLCRAARIVGDLVADAGDNRWLVTTRPHALDVEGVLKTLGGEPRRARILDLDEKDQARFLKLWFAEVAAAGGDEGTLAAGLERALGANPALASLKRTPLLLAMIATVYHYGKNLPDRRADLYEQCVEVLLRRRFGPAAGGSDELVARMKRGLMVVARGMMETGQVRQIGKKLFVQLLTNGFHPYRAPDEEQILELQGLVGKLANHSGLLAVGGWPPEYAFAHLGFQEFLAADWFAGQPAPAELLAGHLDEGPWREVILLTASILLGDRAAFRGEQFIQALVPGEVAESRRQARLALALEALADGPRLHLDPALSEDLMARALEALADGNDPAQEQVRNDLGLALGRLGDPRLGMERKDRWVRLEPGDFSMGSEAIGSNEKPVHQITEPFWLGRFPVTNREYAAFVDDDGYRNQDWWDEAGRDFLAGLKEAQPRYWEDPRWNGPNQPVVGVSWYEARAYCRWLSARFGERTPAWWPAGYAVCLPSEAQWEYAAAGKPGRRYPWGGDEPDGLRANFGDRIGRTTPVGIYPAGTTPEGLHDMAGNVWEWCGDAWDEKAYRKRKEITSDPEVRKDGTDSRSLRGGSWDGGAGGLAAAFRFGFWAWDRSGYVGFRCCVSPAPAVLDA